MVRSCLAAAAALLALACGEGAPEREDAAPTPGDEAPPRESKVGSLSLALETEHGTFETFSYVLTGPSFARSGTIEASNSRRISALIEGIPVGEGHPRASTAFVAVTLLALGAVVLRRPRQLTPGPWS